MRNDAEWPKFSNVSVTLGPLSKEIRDILWGPLAPPLRKEPMNVTYLDCSGSVLGWKDAQEAVWAQGLDATLYGFSSNGKVWPLFTISDMKFGNGGTSFRDVRDHMEKLSRDHDSLHVRIVTDGDVPDDDIKRMVELCDSLSIVTIDPAHPWRTTVTTSGTTETTEQEQDMTGKTLYEYRVFNDEGNITSGEVLVDNDKPNPQQTARDLAVADYVKNNKDADVADVTVVVRPFSGR